MAAEACWFGSNRPLPEAKATGDLLQSSSLQSLVINHGFPYFGYECHISGAPVKPDHVSYGTLLGLFSVWCESAYVKQLSCGWFHNSKSSQCTYQRELGRLAIATKHRRLITLAMMLLEKLNSMEHALTVAEVAKLLGFGKTAIYDMVRRGAIPHIRVGYSVRFDPREIAGWIQHRSVS
jgi:excisionase family DNA binding protein